MDGLILLRSSWRGGRLGAFTSSGILTDALARPAVDAADRHLTAAEVPEEGDDKLLFPFANTFRETLSRSYELNPTPFELVLDAPKLAPRRNQMQAVVAALVSILDSYRSLHGLRPNL